MENKVYIVTSGQYSGYGICAVFRTEKEAQAYIDIYDLGTGYDKAEIEEWELSTVPNKPAYQVYMLKNGDVRSVERRGIYHESATRKATGIFTGRGSNPEGVMWSHMFARDEKHAIKIANERRTFLIATDRWYEGNFSDAVQSLLVERED